MGGFVYRGNSTTPGQLDPHPQEYDCLSVERDTRVTTSLGRNLPMRLKGIRVGFPTTILTVLRQHTRTSS